ncbi:MAG TPA: LamG domain-containing protein [Kofleriaceae bacterium]
MERSYLIVALVAGCGSVNDSQPTDAAVVIDAPATVHLMDGCIYKAAMDEAAWPATGKPVLDGCGSDVGGLSGSGAMPIADAIRGQVGNFSDNACIDVANSAQLHGAGALTMAAWVRPIALDGSTSNGIISKRNDKSVQSEFGLFLWTRYHAWIDLGDTDRYEGSIQLVNNQWAHVVAIFDGGAPDADRVRLYINGHRDQQVVHSTAGNLKATLPTYTAPLHIGCVPAPSATPATQQTFQGQLDDVTIWNRALNDDELATLATPR